VVSAKCVDIIQFQAKSDKNNERYIRKQTCAASVSVSVSSTLDKYLLEQNMLRKNGGQKVKNN